jgi:hypothetical protein
VDAPVRDQASHLRGQLITETQVHLLGEYVHLARAVGRLPAGGLGLELAAASGSHHLMAWYVKLRPWDGRCLRACG